MDCIRILQTIIDSPWPYKLGLIIGGIIVVDMFAAFRYYYLRKYYIQIMRKAEEQRLNYLRKTVISGYKILAEQNSIDNSILAVRKLEAELDVEPYDFTSYKEKYTKDINNVLKRGYF